MQWDKEIHTHTLVNLAAMRSRKADNDSNGLETAEYGEKLVTVNAHDAVINLDPEARKNEPESLAIVKGEHPLSVVRYLTTQDALDLCAKWDENSFL